MIRIVFPLALALPLAACGPSVSVTNASVADVEKAVGELKGKAPNQQMRAGEWELNLEALDIKGDGITPDRAAAMKASSSGTRKICITEAEVKDPIPAMLQTPANACRYGKYEIRGNKLDVEFTCKDPTSSITVKATATFKPEALTFQGDSDVTFPGGKQSNKLRATGKYLGACPPQPAMPPMMVPPGAGAEAPAQAPAPTAPAAPAAPAEKKK